MKNTCALFLSPLFTLITQRLCLKPFWVAYQDEPMVPNMLSRCPKTAGRVGNQLGFEIQPVLHTTHKRLKTRTNHHVSQLTSQNKNRFSYNIDLKKNWRYITFFCKQQAFFIIMLSQASVASRAIIQVK